MKAKPLQPAARKKTASKAVRRAPRRKRVTRKRDPAVERGYQKLFELAAKHGTPYFPFGPPVVDE